MKKIIVAVAVLGSALSGCVAYEVDVPVARSGPYYNSYGAPVSTYRDRDGDGVPNRFDDRPDNPRRH
jgi:hypothetical protein